MAEHAIYSPSRASRFMRCTGSIALESICPDSTNKYAAEGSCAHTVAEKAFKDGNFYARAYLGEVYTIDGFPVEVTEDMCEHVQEYIDNVRDRIEQFKLLGNVLRVTLLIEQKINLSNIMGVANQFGTADVVILVEFNDDTALISVEDLKYGMGVRVDALDNEQLMTYGAGVYDQYSLILDIKQVIVAIHQIRLGHISEATYTKEEILAFGGKLKEAVNAAEIERLGFAQKLLKADQLTLVPGDKQCCFCKAAAICPMYADRVIRTVSVTSDFANLNEIKGTVVAKVEEAIEKMDDGTITIEQLSEFMKAADLIEDWLHAVRARVQAELFAGNEVPDFKLVEGRRGHRVWQSETEVEKLLKGMRLKADEMYTRKVINPTTAEKMLKYTPRRWNALKPFITQSEGKPSVAPASDKRPALKLQNTSDMFANLETGEDMA